ncbi:hypothetical protein DM860_005845 [Cuscuta australis]|uniref:Uncharacterized protein n=1 Tax=Cuscuta australis TaxID=267555 RepID=A0A328DW62_9ASTE|nr:hypothetical protein DM860_005845 [Cuscuta australis]
MTMYEDAVVTIAYMAEETFLIAKRWRQLTYGVLQKTTIKGRCKATLDIGLVDEKDTTFNGRFVGGFYAWDVKVAMHTDFCYNTTLEAKSCLLLGIYLLALFFNSRNFFTFLQ